MRLNGRPLTEKAFLGMVLKLARLHRWLCYHTHDSRRSAAGFPDLILLHPEMGVMLAVEVKLDGGRLRPEQKR